MMSEGVSRCSICRDGLLVPGFTAMEFWCDGELVVLRDIPADVCQQCGDGLLSSEVAKKLEQFFSERHNHKPEKHLTVPQYSAAQFMDDS